MTNVVAPSSPTAPRGLVLSPAAALLVLLTAISTPASGQTNLVANSGFSPGTLCPGQWSGPCADGFAGTLNSDLVGLRVVTEEDNTILEMTLPRVATAAPHAVATWTGGPVSPQTYEVSVSTRASALKGKARLVAAAERQDGGSYTTLASAQVTLPAGHSTWIRSGLRLEAPSGTDRIRVELQGDASCPSGHCGTITFDNLKVAPAEPGRFLAGPFENDCPEGEFLDVATLQCLPRVTSLGFSSSEFAAAISGRPVETVGACTETSLRAAVERVAANGGGILRLPSCEIELTRALTVPGSILIEGAGTGNSILKANPSECGSNLIQISKRQHVTLRDFSLDGQVCVEEPVSVLFSDNVNLERLEVARARRNGLIVSHSKRITLRYNTAHNSSLNNGLSSKDCFLEGNETQITTATCESRILRSPTAGGSVAPGAIWTENYAVYSNHLFDNPNDHGLAMHSGLGEIAGNLIEGNLRGIKLPDARDVRVHHNRLRRNELWGIHIYTPIVDRPPTNFVIAQNEFTLNGEFVIRLEGSKDVFLADNRFDRNFDIYHEAAPWGFEFPKGSNVFRISLREFANSVVVTPETFACSGGQDATLLTSGSAPLPLTGSACATYLYNLPPVVTQDTASTAPGVAVSLSPLANDRDADGDELRYVGLVSGPFNGTTTTQASILTYTPSTSFTGTEVMSYRAEDSRGGYSIGEIRIQVAASNRSPVAGNDQAATFQNTPVTIQVLQNDSDPDSDPIQIARITTAPRNGKATIDGNRIVYTPAQGFVGSDTFVYEISDGRGGVATALVSITVSTQPNRNPVARNDTVTTSISSPILIDVLGNDEDPDGDMLLFARFVTPPARGTVTFVEGKVRYLPHSGVLGSDSFSYEIADGQGGSAIAGVYISITNAPNSTPSGVDDLAEVTTDAESALFVLANDTDPDGDRLFITRILQPPHNGKATFRSNAILYTSVAGFVGEDSLSYALADGRGGESQAVVRIRVVEPVDSEPQVPPTAVQRIETYPNPTSGTLHIRYSVAAPAAAHLKVYDMLGRTVFDAPQGNVPPGEHSYTIDVSHLPGGVYLLTLEAGTERWSRMIGVTR